MVFEVDGGRPFVARKAVDVASTVVLMALVLVSLVLVFVGGGFAEDLLGFLGLGSHGRPHLEPRPLARRGGRRDARVLLHLLRHPRRPAAVVPLGDARARSPASCCGCCASAGFSIYVSQVADVGAIYGAFAGAIVLVAWLWLTNVALLFGAELNAEIEREQELAEGVPRHETLDLPNR